jgi:type I restriction enzyme, R subunit
MTPSGGFSEESTVQSMVVEQLATLGWEHVPADQLGRSYDDILCEDTLVEALVRLNPEIAADPDRVDEVLPRLRADLLAAHSDGVVQANEWVMRWLRGHVTHQYVGTADHVPVRLIDFDDLARNRFVVSGPGNGHTGRRCEVQYPAASTKGGSAFDVVLWVNGIPLVVGETKTPVSHNASWLNAANDIHDHYEAKHPSFFAANVLSFATEGKELHYGAVGQPGEKWLQWGHTEDPLTISGLARVQRSIELLLTPDRLLSVLRDFTLFDRPKAEGGHRLVKLIPRYPQVEAVEAIVDRVKDSLRRRGLIAHYQGSGKTLTQAYAALALLNDPDVPEQPTIVCVFDRVDLITQTATQFSTALPSEVKVKVAATKEQLRRLLASDERGLILTTIFRFADAGEALNDRSNIIVMVDEAHRTQEGTLGEDMRAALPNAQFFGLTGTPIATTDRNTYRLFGDPDDDGWVLNRYTQARSVRDGTTVPIHVEARMADWHLDQEALDEAFADLAEAEGLTVEQQELLARKGARQEVVLSNPARIRAICEDIVAHYDSRVAPSGMKAQVVVHNRALCVQFHDTLVEVLADRGLAYEAAVVMTTGTTTKGFAEPPDWHERFGMDPTEEEALIGRYLDHTDTLSFLIVTSKLLTGFDAPIESVMYLDRPLRLHTLSQAMARTNRRWTHPDTGVEKTHGLIVDYVGLGAEIKKALRDAQPDLPADERTVDVDGLADELDAAMADALVRFDGIDRADTGWATLQAAQDRLAGDDDRAAFAADVVRVSTLWEFLHPHPRTEPHTDGYRFIAKVYESVQPSGASDALLWRRLGPKTIALVHDHISLGAVTKVATEVILDDETLEAIRQLAEQERIDLGESEHEPAEPVTVADALDTIARRLARLADDHPHEVFTGLAERLRRLRERHIASAEDSQHFLADLLDLTQQVKAADAAARDGTLDENADAILDPRIGALTQVFEQYAPPDTPVIVGNVVRDIDQLVKDFAFDGWADSMQASRELKRELRLLLKDKYGLPPTGDLFDKAYEYISENY